MRRLRERVQGGLRRRAHRARLRVVPHAVQCTGRHHLDDHPVHDDDDDSELPAPGGIAVTLAQGTTDCGGPGPNPSSVAPFSGEIDDGTGTKLKDLGLGCLYIGGGNALTLPGTPLPDGSTSILDVSGANGLQLTLAASNGTGPDTCTLGAGPGKHCANTSLAACTSDADCGGQKSSCQLDANCFFGPPAPVPAGPLTSCVVDVIGTDPCGAADLQSGNSSLTLGLSARPYLTGNAPRSEER